MVKISERFYDSGYHLNGEGMRLDIIDSENRKYLEIFFLQQQGVLVMTPYEFRWGKSIASIGVYHGLPQVELIK